MDQNSLHYDRFLEPSVCIVIGPLRVYSLCPSPRAVTSMVNAWFIS